MRPYNDYEDLYDVFYRDLFDANNIKSDFSGWEQSPNSVPLPFEMRLPNHDELSKYYADAGTRIANFKESLRTVLPLKAGQSQSLEEFTIFPSTTSALLAVLALLKDLGVNELIVEAPAYYFAIEHAERLGFSVTVVAPIVNEEGKVLSSNFEGLKNALDGKHKGLLLHQPRFSIGSRMRQEEIDPLIDILDGTSYLIIDEACDTNPPIELAPTMCSSQASQIFRVRSLVKPFGLNGLNLAYVSHDKTFRHDIVEMMWASGGTLDWFSLQSLKQIGSLPGMYGTLLKQARERLQESYNFLLRLSSHSCVKLSEWESGFLCCVIIDKHMFLRGFDRTHFVEQMASNGVHCMLNTHIYLPDSFRHEYVRVNLFNNDDTLVHGIENIIRYCSESELSS